MENIMIIELLKTESGPNLCLLHFNRIKDNPKNVNRLQEHLSRQLQGYVTAVVMDGEPGPLNPLPKIILFNADNPALLSIVEKISKNTEPGAIIPLTAEEMDAWVNSQPTDWTTI